MQENLQNILVGNKTLPQLKEIKGGNRISISS